MGSRGDDQEALDILTRNEARERRPFTQRTEKAFSDEEAPCLSLVSVDEKVPFPGSCLFYETRQPAILVESQLGKPSPFEPADAENDSLGVALPVQVESVDFPLEPPRKDENAIDSFRRPAYVQKIKNGPPDPTGERSAFCASLNVTSC